MAQVFELEMAEELNQAFTNFLFSFKTSLLGFLFYFSSFLVFDGSVLFHFLLKKYLEKVILKKMENEKFSELKTNLFQNGHL